MDRDALRAALDRWTNEELIDESTADRIREFEAAREGATPDDRSREDDPVAAAATDRADHIADDDLLGRGRVVVALALMGGALVAVGIGSFLVERWDAIPVAARVGILLGVPVAAGGGGAVLRGNSPRTAHGLWLLAAIFTGVTLFQIAELAGFDVDAVGPWLLAAWTLVTLVIATGLDSRPVSGLGAVLGGAAVATAIEPAEFMLVPGLYGSLLLAASVLLVRDDGSATTSTHSADGTVNASGRSVQRAAATFRWIGGAAVVVLLALVVAVGPPGPAAVAPGELLLGAAVVLAAGVCVVRARAGEVRTRERSGKQEPNGDRRDDRAGWYAVAPAVVAPIGVGVAWGLGFLGVGDVGGAVAALAVLLLLLFALVAAAIGLGETAPVNVAAFGFVLGVGAFLVGPLSGIVSGPLALVAAGLVLLATGLGAERGRREVLERIR